MKKFGILFIAAGALSLGACTETAEEYSKRRSGSVKL